MWRLLDRAPDVAASKSVPWFGSMQQAASHDPDKNALALKWPDRWRCADVSAKLARMFKAPVDVPMEPHPLDTLTPSERNVLRMLLLERDQKTIARQLNLSPETVKTHLRNAREKTGVRTSFALARALAEQEAHPPGRGIPQFEGEPRPARWTTDGLSKRPEEPDLNDDAFHERRAVFDYGQSSFMAPAPQEEKKRNSLPASTRMLIVIGTGILLIALIILAFPLSESFQRFADVLDPPKH